MLEIRLLIRSWFWEGDFWGGIGMLEIRLLIRSCFFGGIFFAKKDVFWGDFFGGELMRGSFGNR